MKVDASELREGVQDGIPICLGYFSVSMAYGMTAVLSGLPLPAAVMISLTNLTSAGQFAGTNLILAGGTWLELAITMLVINIRYVHVPESGGKDDIGPKAWSGLWNHR